MVGTIAQVTGCDARFITEHHDHDLQELYTVAAAVRDNQREEQERDIRRMSNVHRDRR